MPEGDAMKVYTGHAAGQGLRIGVVVSRFNELVSEALCRGALSTLREHGVAAADVHLAWVPGAFELPLVAKALAHSGHVDAVICLGCIVRGETPHFDLVAAQSAAGCQQAALSSMVPVLYGVLTTETLEQALQRCGGKVGHKGRDVAAAALQMAQLMHTLPQRTDPPVAARSSGGRGK